MVGSHHLHKNVAVVCAGNLETDNAIVQPMSTALQSRMIHLELVVDVKEWIDWASSERVDHRITSYINFMPKNLYNFKADHTDVTYACPRTWEFADRILKVCDITSPDLLPMLSGAISEGVAREFTNFCKIHESLPKIDRIIADPEGVPVPVEPSILFAMTGSLSHNITTDNCEHLIKYIRRLPIEFQVVCLREIIRRDKKMASHPSIQKWISTNANSLF